MDYTALLQLSKGGLIVLLLAQEARIVELKRRLGLNSRNNGKPASSAGLQQPVRVTSLREQSGKNAGGQHRHPSKSSTFATPSPCR